MEPEERLVYTTKEVSQLLGLGMNQTRELIKRRDFPKITYGRKWIIPKNEFHEWLSKNTCRKLK